MQLNQLKLSSFSLKLQLFLIDFIFFNASFLSFWWGTGLVRRANRKGQLPSFCYFD